MGDFHVVGREEELEQLFAFLDDVERLSVGLVLEGEPGIGKTTLWRHGVETARSRGYVVLGCAPARAETQLSFAAAAALGDELDSSLEAAVGAGIVVQEGSRIRFTHPLLASTVYAAAGPAARRRVHRVLAGLVPSSEERARHLAVATVGPDAEAAAVLEQAGEHAAARGAPTAAAELFEQARLLTPVGDVAAAVSRTVAAGTYAFESGDTQRARVLLEDAVAAADPGSERARALARLARVTLFTRGPHAASHLFRQGLAEVDTDSSVRFELEEGLAYTLVLTRQDVEGAAAHARAACTAAEALADRAALAEALTVQGVADFLLGRGEPLALLKPALALEQFAEHLRVSRHPSFPLSGLLLWADDPNGARSRLERLVAVADERGDDASLPWLLSRLSYAEWLAGRWLLARRYSEEAFEAAVRTGHDAQRAIALAAQAVVLAHLGDAPAARAAAETCIELAETTGEMGLVAARGALGVLALSLGELEEAESQLGAIVVGPFPGGIGEPREVKFIGDAVEVLVALDRLDEAELLARRLQVQSLATLAVEARCRGILASARGDLAGSLTAMRRARELRESAPIPFERARTALALGAVLRRNKQKRAAREALEEALAGFERLDARLWAARARSELGRIGGRRSSGDALTPTERRVAGLVAQGLSTKEVAAQLFVSPRTVEGHLSHIYAKLGVRSRAELAGRFAR